MSKLPPISGKNLCKILERLGFEKVYGKGSHIRYKHTDGRRTVIPIHSNEDLSIALLKEILRQIKLDNEEYEKLRKNI